MIIGLILFGIISVLLYHWVNTKLESAITLLIQLGSDVKRMEVMGCKCQETKINKEQVCQDSNEESFRQAYNRMNKEFIQAKAQLADLQQRLSVTETKAKEYLDTLSQQLHNTETYAINALKVMDSSTRSKFIKDNGQPSHSNYIS